MENIEIERIKEIVKFNTELIKILTVFFITIGVGTVSEFRNIASIPENSEIRGVSWALITTGMFVLSVSILLITALLISNTIHINKIRAV